MRSYEEVCPTSWRLKKQREITYFHETPAFHPLTVQHRVPVLCVWVGVCSPCNGNLWPWVSVRETERTLCWISIVRLGQQEQLYGRPGRGCSLPLCQTTIRERREQRTWQAKALNMLAGGHWLCIVSSHAVVHEMPIIGEKEASSTELFELDYP